MKKFLLPLMLILLAVSITNAQEQGGPAGAPFGPGVPHHSEPVFVYPGPPMTRYFYRETDTFVSTGEAQAIIDVADEIADKMFVVHLWNLEEDGPQAVAVYEAELIDLDPQPLGENVICEYQWEYSILVVDGL